MAAFGFVVAYALIYFCTYFAVAALVVSLVAGFAGRAVAGRDLALRTPQLWRQFWLLVAAAIVVVAVGLPTAALVELEFSGSGGAVGEPSHSGADVTGIATVATVVAIALGAAALAVLGYMRFWAAVARRRLERAAGPADA